MSNKIILSIILVVVLAAGGILAWHFWPTVPSLSLSPTPSPTSAPTPLATPTLPSPPSPPSPTPDQTADWKVYRNEEYGFEFRYHQQTFLEVKTDMPEEPLFVAQFTNLPPYISDLTFSINKGVGFEAEPSDEAFVGPLNIRRRSYRGNSKYPDFTFALWQDFEKQHFFLLEMHSKVDQRQQSFIFFDQMLSSFKFIDSED